MNWTTTISFLDQRTIVEFTFNWFNWDYISDIRLPLIRIKQYALGVYNKNYFNGERKKNTLALKSNPFRKFMLISVHSKSWCNHYYSSLNEIPLMCSHSSIVSNLDIHIFIHPIFWRLKICSCFWICVLLRLILSTNKNKSTAKNTNWTNYCI